MPLTTGAHCTVHICHGLTSRCYCCSCSSRPFSGDYEHLQTKDSLRGHLIPGSASMGGGASGSRHSLGQSLLSKKERRASHDPHRQRLPHSGTKKQPHSLGTSTSTSGSKARPSSSSSSSSSLAARDASDSKKEKGRRRSQPHRGEEEGDGDGEDEALMSLLPRESEEERQAGRGILKGRERGGSSSGKNVHWTEMNSSTAASHSKGRPEEEEEEEEETVWLADQTESDPDPQTPPVTSAPRVKGHPLVGLCIEGGGLGMPPRSRGRQVKAAVTSLLDTHFAHSDAVRDFNEAMPVSSSW
jgi:hypothetical protein